jgi:carboxylate-amine ligase
MAGPQENLSLGVEEEFQIVDTATAELVSGYATLMQRATPAIQDHMKPEFLQCVVECITDVCPDVAAVRQQTAQLRATAALLAREHGMAIGAAGTHPTGKWYHQHRTAGARYGLLEDALQDVARSILIYGLHVHVNLTDLEVRIQVMNQARTYLPHILALSVNSPFWMGRYTGFMAFRPIVWAPFPVSGIPDPFPSFADYAHFRELFFKVNSLSEVRRIWWDLRAHHQYPTIEFRIADMPLHHDDTIAIVAFIQALVMTLRDRTLAGQPLPVLPTAYINENRWRAALGGLRGTLVDFTHEREVPTVEALAGAVDLVAPAMEALGAARELAHLRAMLAPGYQSGAEWQIAAFQQHHDPADAAHMLIAETLRGIDLDAALPLAPVPIAQGQRRGPRLRLGVRRRLRDLPAAVL